MFDRETPIRFRCPTCRALLGLADRMAGEEVVCPRCGQRILTPAHQRPPEPALPADRPPPIRRKSIFPEFPVVLDPPEPGIRIGLAVTDPRPDDHPPRPFAAWLVALLLLAGGGWAWIHVVWLVVWSNGGCCFWPGLLGEVVWSVAALGRGVHLLTTTGRPRAPAIVVLGQVLLCGAFDLLNTTLGVLNVLLISLPGSRTYYRPE